MSSSSQELTPNADVELQQLPQLITAWKKVREETVALKEQMRERKVRMKALEEVILRTMKKNSIGALDLKQSGGRLLYKKREAKGSLSQKSLQEYLAEHLKSDEAATKALDFISEKRGKKTMETLSFEKL
jgi:hypothetical protein